MSKTRDPAAQMSAALKERRTGDFLVLLAAALALAVVGALVGEVSTGALAVGALALGGFAFVFFNGTADQEQDQVRALQEAMSESARGARADSARQMRAAMIEALPDPAMFIDSQDKVEAANAAARRRFQFVGQEPLLSLIVRRGDFLDAVAAARREGAPHGFEFIERDETDRYFSCVASPLQTPEGRGVLVTMTDLTDVKRAEMARVDFLANASHELRTPLTSLLGFIETLKGPARDDDAARDRFLDIMHAQAERMKRLISDLMSLSRIELVEHRPPASAADLAQVVAEVGDALMPLAAGRKVKLRVMGQASGVVVTGVHDELSQVVQNLVDNAIKYSEAGGVVEIEVLSDLPRERAFAMAGRRWMSAGHMSIAAAPRGAHQRFAVLRVTDAGPGIDRQHLPRLAERFYRVDQGRGLKPGTGLGLAIVKHVVARHRGEFVVESEVGRGTAFGVVLPMHAASAEPGQPVTAETERRA
jgi:two-component system, OmpR family, phosphate regulon sensor histidine kinase PhoR